MYLDPTYRKSNKGCNKKAIDKDRGYSESFETYRRRLLSFPTIHDALQGGHLLSDCFVRGSQLIILLNEIHNGFLELIRDHTLTVSAFASGSTVRRASPLLSFIVGEGLPIAESHFDLSALNPADWQAVPGYRSSLRGSRREAMIVRGRCVTY